MNLNELIPGFTKVLEEWKEASEDQQVTVSELIDIGHVASQAAVKVLEVEDNVIFDLKGDDE